MSGPHYQCKLCNLIKQDEELWIQVHNKVLGPTALSRTVVCRWLNDIAEVKNKSRPKNDQLPTFNNANFTKHFKNHISSEDKFKAEIRRSLSSSNERGSTSFDIRQQVIADSVDKNNTDNINDEYEFLSSMIKIIENKLKDYDVYTNDRDKKSVTKRTPNLREIDDLQKLISNLIETKHSLIKLKHSDKMIHMALRSAIETISISMMEKLVSSLEEVRPVFMTEMGNDLPTKLLDSVKFKMGNELKMIVPDILNRIVKDFNLK